MALVLVIVLAACSSGATGERLPDVAIIPLTGGDAVSLQTIEGPAVVNLWATWCAPCLREIPEFEAEHQARDGAVAFVGINIGEEAPAAASFLAEVGATYDQYLDPQGRASTELSASSLPVTVVIDADGVVSTISNGEMSRADLRAAIDRALDDGSQALPVN